MPFRHWIRGHRKLAVAILAFGTLAVDAAILDCTSGEPEFAYITKESGKQQPRLTVYLAGMQVDGYLHSLPLHPLWLEYGDVLVVRYDPRLLSRSKVKKATFRRVVELNHEEVVLNVTSVGGRLGTDFIDYNQAQGEPMKITGFIGNDLPMIGSGVNEALGWPTSILGFPGYSLNLALGGAVGAMHEPPSFDQIEPGIDRESIQEHWEVSANWPLSGVTSQARAVFWRQEIPAGTYRGIPFRLLRSEGDNVVSREADPRWLQAFGVRPEHVFTVSAEGKVVLHASFREFPTAWRGAQARTYHEFYPAG